MSASTRGMRDRSRKAQPGIKVILVRIPCRANSAAKLPFHGQTATTSRSGRFSRIAETMSRNPTAPPPPKLPTFEITNTRGTGLDLREAVMAPKPGPHAAQSISGNHCQSVCRRVSAETGGDRSKSVLSISDHSG